MFYYPVFFILFSLVGIVVSPSVRVVAIEIIRGYSIYSSAGTISELNGTIPPVWKQETAFSSVADFRYDSLNSSLKFSVCILLPGWFLFHVSQALLKKDFKGLKTALSSGCNLCVLLCVVEVTTKIDHSLSHNPWVPKILCGTGDHQISLTLDFLTTTYMFHEMLKQV